MSYYSARQRVAIEREKAGTDDWECHKCGSRTWNGRCSARQCPDNAQRYLNRHARRLRVALAAWKGPTRMVTLTAPGQDLIPWDASQCLAQGPHQHTGDAGCKVDLNGQAWNEDMWTRWKVLRETAARAARRTAPPKTRSGILAVVPEMQKRGVWHLHVILGYESPQEQEWCEAFLTALERNRENHRFGVQFHPGEWARQGHERSYVVKLSRYVNKVHGVREALENWILPGRWMYVSTRLTQRTRCTMRTLARSAVHFMRDGVKMRDSLFSEWYEYENALGRQLTAPELLDLTRYRC